MVISPLNVEVKGAEEVKESIDSETQLYWERNRMIPRSFKLSVEAKHKSPYKLPDILFEKKVILRLWLSEKSENEMCACVDKKERDRDEILQEMKMNRFHEIELKNLCFGVGDFGGIADRLDMVGGFFGGEGFPVEYFKLGGTVEEETFILAVDRLKNRITPGISLKPPKQKPKLKINIEYEPAPNKEENYILRPTVFNPGRYYTKEDVEQVSQKMYDILKKHNLPHDYNL